MPRWTPTEDWKGQDVFLIGGGPSLRDFDWSLLEPELTIGCNTAFTLGEKVCKLCIFGDYDWFIKFRTELEKYRGVVFANASASLSVLLENIPWVWTMPRSAMGLHKASLGWNGNTGASAINLALILGAQRVFLLGFDMKRIGNNPNWHDKVFRPEATKPGVYKGFVQDFRHVVHGWKDNFPDREIINVTSDSGLGPELFPWVDPAAFWAERKSRTLPDVPLRGDRTLYAAADPLNAKVAVGAGA